MASLRQQLEAALAQVERLTAQLETAQAQLDKVQAEYLSVVAERDALKAAQSNRTLLISRGHLALVGKLVSRRVQMAASVSWKPWPTFQWLNPATGQYETHSGWQIDRSKPFPQYITGIRANFLVDPSGVVSSVSLVEVNP